MFSMLQFCLTINYCSMWHDDAAFCLGAESVSHSLAHVLSSVGGKLAWPIRAEVKEVNWHRESQTKMADSSIQMCSLICLRFAKSKLSVTVARRNKSSSFSKLKSSHHTGNHLINPGEVRSKHQLVNWSGVNIQLSAMWGIASPLGMSMWYDRC